MRLVNAAGSALIGVVLVAVVAGAFSKDEKVVIRDLRARIALLEGRVTTLEGRVTDIEADPFTFTDIKVAATTPTSATIEWNVSPCATGQVEYGPTVHYGSFTPLEPALLCFHRQRITGLTPNTTYHFRVWATDGAGVARSQAL